MYLTMPWYIKTLLNQPPDAFANIVGVPEYKNLYGITTFYTTINGVIVCSEVSNLPLCDDEDGSKVFGYHIHGDGKKSWVLLPLLSGNGYAYVSFLTDRLKIKEIIGHNLFIYDSFDGFVTQPRIKHEAVIGYGLIEPNIKIKENG